MKNALFYYHLLHLFINWAWSRNRNGVIKYRTTRQLVECSGSLFFSLSPSLLIKRLRGDFIVAINLAISVLAAALE